MVYSIQRTSLVPPDQAVAGSSDSPLQASITAAKSIFKLNNLETNINVNVSERVNTYLQRFQKYRENKDLGNHEKIEKIINDMQAEVQEVIELRNAMFECIDTNTGQADIKLKIGKTEQDRNNYIEKLIELYQVNVAILKKDNFLDVVLKEFFSLPDSALLSDVKAIEEGNPIPDFRYLKKSEETPQVAISADECRLNIPTKMHHHIYDFVIKKTVKMYMHRLKNCRGKANEEKIKLLEQIRSDADQYVTKIEILRKNTFEYVDKYTDQVYGKLMEGKDERDRDKYILKLIELSEIEEKIKQEEVEAGLTHVRVFLMKPDVIHGDLLAFKNGNVIPDFYRNAGALQLG